MRRIEDDLTLAELHASGQGFIYNDFAGLGADGHKYNVLHAASCYWNGRSNTNVPKFFFKELAEAERWLQENRGAEGSAWKRCGSCGAAASASAALPAAKERAMRNTVARPASWTTPKTAPGQGQEAQYLVARSGSAVEPVLEAWSARRLPFEPKGWLGALRHELRRELQQMKARPPQLLHGIYGSGDAGHFDVENVLFYNVGPHFLSNAGRYGVRFERAYRAAKPQQAAGRPLPHYHRYALGAMDWQFAHWQSGSLMARWQFTADNASVLQDCARVWLALKRSPDVVVHDAPVTQRLVLRIVVGLPQTAGVTAVGILKPLIDGIVSALHYHNGGDEMELARRLEARTGAAPHEIGQLLTERQHALLGGRQLVRKWGRWVQWNPADERCVAVEVHLRSPGPEASVVVRGEIRQALQLGDARNDGG